ncbi:uncharacterized protein LOC114120710 [Aphis gossypii]|uniref:Uncharacterized protein n=1 Tax=Aphis gossypii TaxID=80765 RepID=A0A9P0NL30_APHGO|nr:uncharacterized protein LOC114120710 [Aphis gossypii]CAH1724528.1 unnamed protein product [Aphis gossypii]
MQVRHVIGLMLFLAAVPLQMYLMKYNQNFKDLTLEIVKNLQDGLLQLSNFVAGYVWVAKNYLHSTYEYLGLSESLEDDSIEDQEIPENSIRNFRPPHLEFRIGNVILMHTMIPGIVVGWNIDITDLTKEPEYLVLTEFHEKMMKIDQDKIIIQLENIKINHKDINKYFESFDGVKYIPNKFLKKMYPKD